MKSIYVLIIAVLVAIAAAVWLLKLPKSNDLQSQLLFSDFAQFANDIHNVEIRNAQGVVFSADKSENNWMAIIAPQLPGYPISEDKLADLVSALLQVKLVEPKTSKTKNYNRLGLQDINNTDSLASLVTLKSKKHTWSVLVGNTVSFTEGSYVRLPNNKQSWRTDNTINLPLDKFAWLKQPILPFSVQDIVKVSRVDQSYWRMEKQSDGIFYLEPMPKGRALEYQGILDSMVSSIVELSFEKLLVSDEIAPASLNILAELALENVQGEIVRLVVSEMDGQHLVSFHNDVQSEYWYKWHYQISNFSAQQLIKIPEDFLAEKSEFLTDDAIDNTKAVEEGESPN